MAPQPSIPASFQGIHHVKLPAINLQQTIEFYTTVLPFVRETRLDHKTPPPASRLFAAILSHPSIPFYIEIRENPGHAKTQEKWDPITWAVDSKKDLDDWANWFDAKQVKRSPVLKGFVGWVLVCEDPDGRFVRIYCKEEHEWTTEIDKDEYWLGN